MQLVTKGFDPLLAIVPPCVMALLSEKVQCIMLGEQQSVLKLSPPKVALCYNCTEHVSFILRLNPLQAKILTEGMGRGIKFFLNLTYIVY